MKINILKETLYALNCNKKQPSDISFITINDNNFFNWEDYCKLTNIQYEIEKNIGDANIHYSLVIVFKDGSWLRRNEEQKDDLFEYIVPPTIRKRSYKRPETNQIFI